MAEEKVVKPNVLSDGSTIEARKLLGKDLLQAQVILP